METALTFVDPARDRPEIQRRALAAASPPPPAAKGHGNPEAGVRRCPAAVSVNALKLPEPEDGNTLLGNRFLCRGGGLLLVGPTGVGKSSISLQLMIAFALGRECLGLKPGRPLKSLLIQAENDEGDLAEIREGVMSGMNLTEEERQQAGDSVLIATEDTRAGMDFFTEVLAPLLETHRPDLVWIDPALAFIDGEANSQEDVGGFLRRGLNPLIHQYRCGAVVVHHTNKPLRSEQGQNYSPQDFAYAGAGSAEWANWSCATLTLDPRGEGEFCLIARKRGSRLGWRDDSGSPTNRHRIAHCREAGRILWQSQGFGEDVQRAGGGRGGKPRATVDDLMELVPVSRRIGKNQLREAAKGAGINEKVFANLLGAALEGEQLFESGEKRTTGPPAKFISRLPASGMAGTEAAPSAGGDGEDGEEESQAFTGEAA